MDPTETEAFARALVAPGKGILAADESTGTIEKRLTSVGVPSTPETRRAYRELLFTTPGLGAFISGAILYDETIRQKASDGRPFPEVLRSQGILPGIKVDLGARPLAGFPGDKVTEGLDRLRERLSEYFLLGARFTKWRAVFAISPGTPGPASLESNAEALARFAALTQEAGMVPIVEPEVLMDGPHGIDRHFSVSESAQRHVFRALFRHRVHLGAMLLKPNMVLSGTECPVQASVDQVASETLRCLRGTVPPAVPGIVFLSGGQKAKAATEHLNAIRLLGKAPWQLSFSFGRALQDEALQAWTGSPERTPAAQRALLHRARCSSAASSATYSAAIEADSR